MRQPGGLALGGWNQGSGRWGRLAETQRHVAASPPNAPTPSAGWRELVKRPPPALLPASGRKAPGEGNRRAPHKETDGTARLGAATLDLTGLNRGVGTRLTASSQERPRGRVMEPWGWGAPSCLSLELGGQPHAVSELAAQPWHPFSGRHKMPASLHLSCAHLLPAWRASWEPWCQGGPESLRPPRQCQSAPAAAPQAQ